MDWIEALLATLFAICVLALVRNKITFEHQMRRLEEIHDYYQRGFDLGIYPSGFQLYDEMPRYYAMMFDLTKWTYRQFFEPLPQPKESQHDH